MPSCESLCERRGRVVDVLITDVVITWVQIFVHVFTVSGDTCPGNRGPGFNLNP